MSNRFRWRIVAAWVALVLVSVAPVTAPARGATPQKVNEAVAKAVKYLYDIQNRDTGDWELAPAPRGDGNADVAGRQWGGLTAMATYALLAAGEDPKDARLAKAIDWLLNPENSEKIKGTYAVGLRAQVWPFLPDKHPKRAEIRAAIKRDRDLLLTGFIEKKNANGFGFWGYFPKHNGRWDLSNSQYAVLGVWATEQGGAEIPRDFWELQEAVWKKQQNPDGGWGYNDDRKDSTATMTAAGVATLFITHDYLVDLRRDCQGNVNNTNIDMGLAFMDRNVSQLLEGNFYGMYGVERIGVASGRKYFGKLDWYQYGSDFLVKHQKPNGSWGDPDGGHNAKAIPNTCFSIYFLTRGRGRVMMNKLEYAIPAKNGAILNWNQRPRDLSNFSKWMSRALDNEHVNWQVVNLKVQAHELHDAPILYIAGSEPLAFGQDDMEKLRRYVEEGGMILGNADCGNNKFARSFTALGHKLFPTYEFRDLEQSHAIFKGQFPAEKWRRRPKVLSLGNGVRELMVLVPSDDLSKAWQAQLDRQKEELFMLPANAYFYSVKEAFSRFKGETYIVQDNDKGKPEHAIKVARLLIGNNPDPEPGGWRRLGTVLKNASVATLETEPVKLGGGKLKGHKIAHLTGTTKVKLSKPQKDEIKQFVDAGGTLIVDAAGGSSEFADTIADELATLFGGGAAKALVTPLPPTHGLYNLPEMKIDKVGYRNYAKGRLVGRLNNPRVAAIEVNGRPAVFYSREDLSAGLVGNPVDGVLGYDAETATAVMRNLLAYAATDGKGFPPPKKEEKKEEERKPEPTKPAPKPPTARAGGKQ